MTDRFDQQKEDELMEWLTQRFGMEVFTPGLSRTRPLYAPFIHFFKEKRTKIITIAGTNGKGQTAHTLASYLKEEKKSVALWTSPHILSLRERFAYGGAGELEDMSYAELKQAMEEGAAFLQKEWGRSLGLSFYEFLFFVFLLVAQKKAQAEGTWDYLLLEVGLGGRLDAVNHFDADGACVTSISRDHQAILGKRFDQILGEKLGVARAGRPLWTSLALDYLNDKVKEYTRHQEILWRPLELTCEPYFVQNQKMAWAIFRHFCPDSTLLFEEATERLPLYKGRREVMTFEGKSLIFIGAHNIDGVRKMLETYRAGGEEMWPDALLASFSKRPLKEVEVMMKALAGLFNGERDIAWTSFSHPKALEEESIKACAMKMNQGMLNFVADWKAYLKNSKAPSILVCGSYYFIGEVQRFLRS